MKLYKTLLAALVTATMAVTLSSCEGDMEQAPLIYPEQVGDGSGAAPYNVGTALVKIYTGQYTQKKVYVEGIVSSIESFEASYGNITYYITDEGADYELEVYRGYGLGGAKFTSADELQVGDKVIIYAQLTYYNNSVAETNQGAIIVSLNGSPYEYDEPVDPVGSGTYDDPYNVTKALDIIFAEQYTTAKVYVKGIVSQIDNIDTSYGNATYYISDSGRTLDQLEIYRGYGFGGAKFTSTTAIQVGDSVIVYGQVTLFNSTAEFTTGSSIVWHNGTEYGGNQGGSTAEPAGSGTASDPYNIARCLEIINAGTYTSSAVYLTGIVSQIDNIDTSYGNATYYLSDDGTTTGQLEIYRGYGLDGAKFTSTDAFKVGDKLVVYGVLTMYNTTPEVTTGSSIISINGEGGGNNPGGDETTIYSGLGATDANGLDGWTIDNADMPDALSYIWSWKEYNSAYYLNASAYLNSTNYASEAYIYTTVDLSGYKTAAAVFEHAAKFQTTCTELCGVVVRETGSGTWTKLTIPVWPASGSWTFASSGAVSLDAYAGKKVDFGFLYKSSTAGADTWEIKNLTVTGSK